MSAAPKKSLKSSNLPWVVALVALDVIVMAVFVFTDLIASVPLTQLTVARAAVTGVLPVAVLLLSAVVPQNIKAMLVYWKIKNPLPGSEAFTRHAPADPRIDMTALRKNVGPWDDGPAEQNSLWYKLYKKVGSETAVVEAHRSFLLFRDMAVVSLLLAGFVPLGLWITNIENSAVLFSLLLFAVQYVFAALAARHSGIRFVTNVLAEHSVRKVTAPKAPA
jgi:hypothetical protein